MLINIKGQDIQGFAGVNLRQDRVSLDDTDVARAINADFHTQPGVLLKRLGRSRQFSTALSSTEVRRLFKKNGACRYQVAGTTLYRAQTSIVTGLSSNHVTTLQPFRPLNDTTTWVFIADDAILRKDDCTNTYTVGIAAHGAILVGIGYSSGSLSGNYSARVTLVRLVGTAAACEGNPSSASSTIAPSSNYFCYGDLTATTTQEANGVNAFGLYRTAAAGASYLRDAYVSIPTTSAYTVSAPFEAAVAVSTLLFQPFRPFSTTARVTQSWETASPYTGTAEDASGRTGTFLWEITNSYVTTQQKRWAYASNLADTALTDAIETDNDVPPAASWIFPYQEHLFYCRDASNPHYLWWSKRFRPEQVPTDNFLEIGNPDDAVLCGVAYAGIAGVFTRLTKYRILGNTTSGFVAQEHLSRRGTPAPNAVTATEMGVFFAARDGVFVTNFTSADEELTNPIESLFFGETVNEFAPINWTYANKFSMAYWKGRLYFAYVTTSATTPDMLAVYSFDTKRWYFYDHPLRSFFFEEENDQLTAGTLTGYTVILESGSTDEGSAYTLSCQTKDFVGEEGPKVLKLFQYMKVEADPGGETVTLALYLDDTLKTTQTINYSGRSTRLLTLPEGCLGYRWRIHITHSGSARIKVYGVSALYAPLAAA